MSSKQNNLVILRFLGFDNVADIEELVVPGVQRVNEKSWSSIRSGTTPARDRRDFFLTQRHERDDAEVDRVAAGLLVIRDELAQRHVLALNKALAKPCRAVVAAALAI